MKLREIVAAATMALASMTGRADAAPPEAPKDTGAESPAQAAPEKTAPEKAAPRRLSPQVMQQIVDAQKEIAFFQGIGEPVPREPQVELARLMVRPEVMEKHPQKVEALINAVMDNPENDGLRAKMKSIMDPQRMKFEQQNRPRVNAPEEKALFELPKATASVDMSAINGSKFAASPKAPEQSGPGNSGIVAKQEMKSPGPPPPPSRAAKPQTPG